MIFPRLPEWLTYAVVVGALTLAALGRRENADAPPAPPPPSKEEGAFLASAHAFERTIPVEAHTNARAGTAFSVGAGGVWLTARHVVEGCRRIAVMEARGRGAVARLVESQSTPDDNAATDVAVLVTQGGAPSLPLASPSSGHLGDRGFHPGFPAGAPGEVTSRFMGSQRLVKSGRDRLQRIRSAAPESVLAWAEAGRTDGMGADLSGLSGAPVLDSRGDVVGVTLAQAPRRGRIYSSTSEAMRTALREAHLEETPGAASELITVENYGRAADTYRRQLQVVQVVCLDP